MDHLQSWQPAFERFAFPPVLHTGSAATVLWLQHSLAFWHFFLGFSLIPASHNSVQVLKCCIPAEGSDDCHYKRLERHRDNTDDLASAIGTPIVHGGKSASEECISGIVITDIPTKIPGFHACGGRTDSRQIGSLPT